MFPLLETYVKKNYSAIVRYFRCDRAKKKSEIPFRTLSLYTPSPLQKT